MSCSSWAVQHAKEKFYGTFPGHTKGTTLSITHSKLTFNPEHIISNFIASR